MKLNRTNYPASVLGILLVLSGADIQAGTMGEASVAAPASEKVYVSVFGGGGSANQSRISQYGSAFFPEASGGVLAVNAFGYTDSRDIGMVGAHLGYQWRDIALNPFNSEVSLSPAVELEGYYIGKTSFTGHEIDNDVTRILEHDFLVTYPMSTGVFLANAMLNFNSTHYARWRPYVGAGIGAAVLSVSNANSLQVAPFEANVNHYNSNPDNTVAAFAAQAKVGLNFAFNEHLSLFAEYRRLYIADTNFTFGSTVYPTHVPTSNWNATLGSQEYNIGAGGIRFTV